MSATVGTLMDSVHSRAWRLRSTAGDERGDEARAERVAALVVAWPQLATASLRVLDAVRLEPAWMDDTASVREVLRAVATSPAFTTTAVTPPGGARVRAHRPVMAMATRLAAVADLLAGQPGARSEVDRAAIVGLQADVISVVHTVAVTTLADLDDHSDAQARWLIRGVVARSERFARVPATGRAGRYDDVAAVRSDDRSLDATISEWVRATVDVLSSRHRVTQTSLQFAAGDALILTAAAGTICAAATQSGIVQPDRGERAQGVLSAMHSAWRPCVSWPAVVRLGGVRDVDQFQASRALRQRITDDLREGRAWLPADTLAARFDLESLMGSTRRGMHGLGNVALAHFQAVDRQVRGPGRLWMAATAVTQEAYWGYPTIEAALRKGWIVMPPGEPAGAELLTAAKLALTTTTLGVAALDSTAAARHPASSLELDRGRIVARDTLDQPGQFETVRTSRPDGALAQRRAPIPMGHHPQVGPRR